MTGKWIAVESTPTVKEARGPLHEKEEIDTREGTVVAEPGDWVIREEDGNCYPIGPEKFKEYYDIWVPPARRDDPSGPFEWFEDYALRMAVIFGILWVLTGLFRMVIE